MKTVLPPSVVATLWSYDTSNLDIITDKNRIILQVLNHGSADAIAWLKTTYPKDDLVHVLHESSQGEWTKKSLNYWSLLFNTTPKRVGRFS
jgi:hypothetical protein